MAAWRATPEGPDPGSTSLQWWRRRELNPRPRASRERPLHAQPLLSSRPTASRKGKTAAGQPRIEFADPSGEPDRLHPHLASATETRRVRFSSHRHCALITQRERDCCYWQLSFFTFFTRWVRPRHATFRVLVPVEAVSPPRARSLSQRSERNINTRAQPIFHDALGSNELPALGFQLSAFRATDARSAAQSCELIADSLTSPRYRRGISSCAPRTCW